MIFIMLQISALVRRKRGGVHLTIGIVPTTAALMISGSYKAHVTYLTQYHIVTACLAPVQPFQHVSEPVV